MCSDCSGVSVQLQEEWQVEKELSHGFKNVKSSPWLASAWLEEYAVFSQQGLVLLNVTLTH